MLNNRQFLTADNTDVLSGTDLANIPSDGQLDLFIASTQNDTQVTITGPGIEPAGRLIRVEQRTNGQPSTADSVPYSLPVTQGGHYVINVDIVTAATVGFEAVYRSLEELGLA